MKTFKINMRLITNSLCFFLTVIAPATSHSNTTANANQNDLLLIKAILTNNITLAEQYLDKGADPNATLSSQNETALIYAITRTQSESLVKKLLNKGADANLSDYSKTPPLFYAIQTGNVSMIKAFIDYGANVNAEAGNYTALILATEKDQLEIVEMLLDAGVNINHQNNSGLSPLTLAKHKEYQDIISLLKTRGAVEELFENKVNASVIKQIGYELASLNATYASCARCNNKQNQCSDCQSINGLNEVLDLNFLRRKEKSNSGLSSLVGVISRDGKDVLGNLYSISPGKNGVHVSDQTFEALLQYIKGQPISLFSELITPEANGMTTDEKEKLNKTQKKAADLQNKLLKVLTEAEDAKSNGDQPQFEKLKSLSQSLGAQYQLEVMNVTKAARNSVVLSRHDEARNELIMALMEHDLSRKIGESKQTPINLVVTQRHNLYLMKLLQLPFQINALKNRKLSSAVSSQNTLALRMLLAYGANPNLPDRNGNYPIHQSIAYPAQLDLLLKYGADPKQKTKLGKTALIEAERMKNHFSQQLLKNALGKNTSRNDYTDLLNRVAKTSDINTIKQLQNKGLKLDSNAFHAAVNHNRKDVLQFLLDQGLDVKEVQIEYPLLRVAVANKNLEITKLLIKKGAEVDEPFHLETKTPLMLAAESDQIDIAKLLLSSGADTNIKDKRGLTALYYSGLSNNPEMDMLFPVIKRKSNHSKTSKRKPKKPAPKATEPNAISQGEAYMRALDVISDKVVPNQKANPWDLIDSQTTELIQIDGKEVWQVTFTQKNKQHVRLLPLVIQFSAQGELISVSK